MGDDDDRVVEHIQILAPLYNTLSDIFARIGICDFCFMDLTQPDPKKTRRYFSNLLNLRVFILERERHFNDILQEKEEKQARFQQLRQKVTEKKTLLNDLKVKKAENELKEPEWERIMAASRENLAKELDRKREMYEERNCLKKRLHDLEMRLEETMKQVAVLQSEKGRLASQLVTSPQRVKEGRRDAETRLEEVQQDLETKNRDNDERRKDITSLHHKIKMAEERLTLVKEICDLADSHKQLEGTIERIQSQVKGRTNELDVERTSVQQLKNELSEHDEKVAVTSIRNRQQLQEKHAEWKEKQQYLHDLKMKQKQSNKVHDGYSRTIAELEDRYQQNEKVQARKVQDVITTVSRTMEEFQMKQQKKREEYVRQTEILQAAPGRLGDLTHSIQEEEDGGDE
jgi:chromosome segregation ATPase